MYTKCDHCGEEAIGGSHFFCVNCGFPGRLVHWEGKLAWITSQDLMATCNDPECETCSEIIADLSQNQDDYVPEPNVDLDTVKVFKVKGKTKLPKERPFNVTMCRFVIKGKAVGFGSVTPTVAWSNGTVIGSITGSIFYSIPERLDIENGTPVYLTDAYWGEEGPGQICCVDLVTDSRGVYFLEIDP